MWKMAEGRQHSNPQHNRWNISGIRFKAMGVAPELARAPWCVTPSIPSPADSSLHITSSASSRGPLPPQHCLGTARPDILTLSCKKSQLSLCKSGVWGCPQWPLGRGAPVLLCATAICRAGTQQRTGRKGTQRKKERKGTVETLCLLVSVHETPKEHLVLLVHLVLEYVQVVRGCHSDDVLGGVPSRVQDLFAKVQTVHADLVFPALPPHADLAGFEDGTGFAVLPRRLQRHVALGVAVEHAEEVVVGAGHDDTATGKER